MALKSWVESANDGNTDFPLENLPFGVFRHRDRVRIGVAIGDRILDLSACVGAKLIDEPACSGDTLNALMAAGAERRRALRSRITELLTERSSGRGHIEHLTVPQREVEMLVPASIGDYTDFYASVHHATNVGSMFRPDNPLLPNYKYVPIGYHGRASSIVVSGTSFRRPVGQTRDDAAKLPAFGPSRRLDYEMEVGIFIGRGNELGERVAIENAEERVFGMCLVNDWSARDIQAWEYQPLGPFLAKNFATTISPWVVTLDALEPFRVAVTPRADGDPEPLPYLAWAGDRGFDIALEVSITTERMRREGVVPFRVSRGSFRDMYWTVAQLVAHHASNGCNLRPGDLLASGTVSGAAKESRGCLLERTWRGTEPLELPTGEQRRFLEDGDEVIMRGFCEKPGLRIGFGECRGVVLSAEC